MRRHPNTTRTLLSLLIGAIGMPPLGHAAQLSLAQYPAGTSWREPAPNVIITLDDSGSMGWYDNGGLIQDETKTTSRMYALKEALRTVFDANTQVVADGSIRLAWNTLTNCRAIPTNSGGCGNLNHMRVLDATHRANFLNWVGTPGAAASTSRLRASGSTPTHQAFIAAGDYLRNASATSQESPWAKVPGTTAAPVLSCRRSYNLLMTDGGWNFTYAAEPIHPTRPDDATVSPNTDGTTRTLPDGTVYDVTSADTRLYRDAWGQSITELLTTRRVSTLADLAFHYWATDLAPDLANDIRPRIDKIGSGTRTYDTGANAVSIPEYWNPRNNPATWQHMTTYTIGFGDASRWHTTGSYAHFPVWDAATNDTFNAVTLSELMRGTKVWPNPFKNTLNTGTITLTDSSNTGDFASTNGEARKVELWHMALNSRGKFIPSTQNNTLATAFTEILGEIIKDNSRPITSFANAAASIARSPTTQYTSGYEALTWTGSVRADTLSQDSSGNVTTTPTWCGSACPGTRVTTADKLNALSNTDIANRLVLSWRNGTANDGGVSFEWFEEANETNATLALAQRNLMKAEGSGFTTNAVGQRRMNYIRGDTTVYTEAGSVFRERTSRQGDIVNSTLWYVADPVSNYAFDNYRAFASTHAKRLPMVYVGGNDGMLHGFSGEDGSEKIAYIPKGVIRNLPELTRTSYQHRYFVDGSPFSGDVNWGDSTTPNWRTLLVGTLGAGGKGYFVLDVTTPGPSASATGNTVASNFSKANAGALVVMDRTAHASETFATTTDVRRDIGHIMVNPVLEDGNPQKTTQIVRMNNGRWALVTGNGYNSTNERPVLLIQYLDGDQSLATIVAASTGSNATSNGLSAPRLVDIDGNGTPDVVYAGDLKGNMWKFDVMSATTSDWKVSFGTSSAPLPLYTAVHTAGTVTTPQPITAPPLVRSSERGVAGLMVAFGTGRNVTEADRTATAVQSIYSVLDDTRYKLVSGKVAVDTATPTPVGTGVANLVQQSVDNTAKLSNSVGRDFWTVSQNNVPYTGTGVKKGWYLNLPESGERVLAQMSFFDDSNIIELISVVPGTGGSTDEETCAPPVTLSRSYRTLLNIMDGKRPSVQVMDTNADGKYNADDGNASRMAAGPAEGRVTTKTHQIRSGADGRTDRLARMPELPLRPNWRQLQ